MAMQQDMHTNTQGTRRVLGPCAHVLVAAHTGTWRMEQPQVDNDICIRCGICKTYCPTDCITINKEEKTLTFDWDYCKGCGICANECPKKALKMILEGSGNNGD